MSLNLWLDKFFEYHLVKKLKFTLTNKKKNVDKKEHNINSQKIIG